jgi:hypothetical protein
MQQIADVLSNKGLKAATWELRNCEGIDEQALIAFAEFCAEQVKGVDDGWQGYYAKIAGGFAERAKMGTTEAAVAAYGASWAARRAKRGLQYAQAKKLSALLGL